MKHEIDHAVDPPSVWKRSKYAHLGEGRPPGLPHQAPGPAGEQPRPLLASPPLESLFGGSDRLLPVGEHLGIGSLPWHKLKHPVPPHSIVERIRAILHVRRLVERRLVARRPRQVRSACQLVRKDALGERGRRRIRLRARRAVANTDRHGQPWKRRGGLRHSDTSAGGRASMDSVPRTAQSC